MLGVTAFKVGHPVIFFVLMESYDLPPHSSLPVIHIGLSLLSSTPHQEEPGEPQVTRAKGGL
jgi:hypothetical protein